MIERSVYLAGPMRGHKEFNFPAFHAAAKRLRYLGYDVWSPAERDEADGFDPTADEAAPLRVYMEHDLAAVCRSEAVVLLSGWRESTGATLEVHVARTCEIPVYTYPDLEPLAETIVQEAARLVDGDRGAAYGHPADDFGRTADLWTARFRHKLRDREQFTADDVPAAMRLVKESRLVATPRHRDSLVDIAGYARAQEKVWEQA